MGWGRSLSLTPVLQTQQGAFPHQGPEPSSGVFPA